jgi:DNA-directed RNA polymerase subunit beta
LDFANSSAIQIPNLIEVQMKSYQRFLQMDLLPAGGDGGLQSVFIGVSIKDFRECQLEFVVTRSAAGMQVRNLKGCITCARRAAIAAPAWTNPYLLNDVICHKCGTFSRTRRPSATSAAIHSPCNQVRRKRMSRGMTYSAPRSHHTTYDLRQGSDTGAKAIRDIKEAEATAIFADDRERRSSSTAQNV